MTPLERAERVCTVLRGYRFACHRELELQQAIAELLTKEGISNRREKHLTRKDRLDLWLDDGVIIEVKIDGSLSDVLRQLSRYAERPTVSVLILVTTRAMHATRMPGSMCGKPVRTVHLSGGLM